jgi:eukaryotic-like serine/threonine-protein kinase
MTTDAQDLFVKGQRIDRYEIREHIGQGGMGTVYRAVDTKLGRIVALKTVVANKRGDKLTEEIRERFMREALAASRVDHRNVVQVLDFGFADDGTPYMVMEHLRGRSLSAILKSASEPLAIDYVADVLLSVCAALRACHHVGIIHRDLKPANIYLCDTDTGWEVKVLDFGISKAPAADELTQDGQIIGTPQYLSPEQIEGTVGNESDQYALGVLLYVCLTQRLPYANFHGVRLLRAISEGQFDPPRTLRADLPEALETIVLRAMHVAPKQRFDSIHALGQRLWEFASPSGQAQWKTFYFHVPAATQPLKPTTMANEPQLRELAREKAAASSEAAAPGASFAPARPARGTGEKPRTDSTASLEPAAALAKTEPQPSTVGPSNFAVTKTAAAAGVGVGEPTSLSHSDIAGESALSDARDTGSRQRARRVARWRVAIAVAGIAGLGVAIQRVWRANPPAVPMRAGLVGTPATQAPPAAAAAPVPVSAAPSAPPVPARAASSASASAPTSPSPTKTTQAGAAEERPQPPQPTEKKNRTTRRHKAPKLDQHGIGIPTE